MLLRCLLSILSLVDSVPQVTAALTEALKKGTSFGAPSLNENVLAKVMCASGRLLVWVVTWHPMSFVCVSCEVSHVWTEMCALQCQKRPTIVSKETYYRERERARDRVPRDCVFLSVSPFAGA